MTKTLIPLNDAHSMVDQVNLVNALVQHLRVSEYHILARAPEGTALLDGVSHYLQIEATDLMRHGDVDFYVDFFETAASA